jgi:hypothetical protein
VILSGTPKGPHKSVATLTVATPALVKVSFRLPRKSWISLILNLHNAYVMGCGALYIAAMVDLLKPVRRLPTKVGVHSTVFGGLGRQGAVDYQAGVCMCIPTLVEGEVPSPSSGRCPSQV